MCAFPKRSELYCGLFNDCFLTVCFSLFVCFIVRVRCRHKKFTFAISSPDEFLGFKLPFIFNMFLAHCGVLRNSVSAILFTFTSQGGYD